MPPSRQARELPCWQLAIQLKAGIDRLSRRPAIQRDLRLSSQIREAGAMAPRHIADGFGRGSGAACVRALDAARAALLDCQHHLLVAVDRGYLELAECRRLAILARRADTAIAALQRRLRAEPAHRVQL